MCSIHDLIEEAKSNFDEEVEFRLASDSDESDMQSKGIIAKYNLPSDIIIYSPRLISSNSFTSENKIQILMHELAHAKDFRSCAEKGLLKILVPINEVCDSKFVQANVFFSATVEFQTSNFLFKKFGHELSEPIFKERILNEIIYFSLIPSIEYLCFGEDSDLREKYYDKLNKSLNSIWSPVLSLLEALGFADESLFETGFLKLMDHLGFTVRIIIEPIEKRREFQFLKNHTATQIKVFELVDFDIRRFFNP